MDIAQEVNERIKVSSDESKAINYTVVISLPSQLLLAQFAASHVASMYVHIIRTRTHTKNRAHANICVALQHNDNNNERKSITIKINF